MATKLKNLKIRKVDFVDEGANPDAHIRMLKRKDGKGHTAEEDGKKSASSLLKKMFNIIGKAAGMDQEEIDSAVDEIQKGDSVSFNEKINEVNNRKIADEMWDTCYALQSSLCSILNDEEMDSSDSEKAMQESLDEFYKVVQDSIKDWSGGKSASIVRKDDELSEAARKIMKTAVERLNESIKKAVKAPDVSVPDNNGSQKGEKNEMNFDKSKMTDAERAFLESIEKRYGTDEDTDSENGGQAEPASIESVQAPEEPIVTKSLQAKTEETPAKQTEESDSIYKGLHPAVKAELESLKKFREAAEDKELTEVAKKYAIIGKKPEELVPMFKNLKAAGGTAYNDMITVLDQTVETVEKSGAFSELGKSGHGSNEKSVESKVSSIAKKLLEDNPTMSYHQAMAKAWEDHPELLAEYDEQEGF